MTNALLRPIGLRELRLPNPIRISPMYQYSATKGNANRWRLIHLRHLAQGGATRHRGDFRDYQIRPTPIAAT